MRKLMGLLVAAALFAACNNPSTTPESTFAPPPSSTALPSASAALPSTSLSLPPATFPDQSPGPSGLASSPPLLNPGATP